MGKLAIDLYVQLMGDCIPFICVWALCSIIVRTFLKAAFAGRFEL